jgi:hypothetical protein
MIAQVRDMPGLRVTLRMSVNRCLSRAKQVASSLQTD